MEVALKGLETCHMFVDSVVFKQYIYCLFLRMGGHKKDNFSRRHKYMTPQAKHLFNNSIFRCKSTLV